MFFESPYRTPFEFWSHDRVKQKEEICISISVDFLRYLGRLSRKNDITQNRYYDLNTQPMTPSISNVTVLQPINSRSYRSGQLGRGQSDDDSAPVQLPQALTPHHPQNPRGTSHLPFPYPSTPFPSPVFPFGPTWSSSHNVLPVHLPCGGPRRSPYQLFQSSSIGPVPDAVPGYSGRRPRPQLRYYLHSSLRPRG